MKAVSILITILMATSIAQGAVSSNLVEEYLHQYKKLRSLLLSVEGNRESAEDIVRLQKKIRTLERENGITHLQHKIGLLRIEVCKIQNSNPDAQNLLNQIHSLNRTIAEKTTNERQKMDQLADLKINPSDENEQRNHEHQLKALDKEIKRMTKNERLQIKLLNQQLLNIAEIREKADEVAPLGKKIKEHYESIEEEMKPLDKSIAKHVKAINRRMGRHSEELKDIRLAIKNVRAKISAEEPCFTTIESLRPARWEREFA